MRQRCRAGAFIATALLSLSASAAYIIIDGAVNSAEACTATPVLLGGVVSAVNVTCPAGEESSNFDTAISSSTLAYDGGGDDMVTVTGGNIYRSLLSGDQEISHSLPPLVIVNGIPNGDSLIRGSTNVVDTLGGDDLFIMTGGAVSYPPGGADTASYPAFVYLGDGDDRAEISGGRIESQIAGGDGDDTIIISGDAVLSNSTIGDTYLSVVGANGDDRIFIRGGTLYSPISGDGRDPGTGAIYTGRDLIEISGGLIFGAVRGGADDDVIRVLGGDIQGDILGDEVWEDQELPSTLQGDDNITISGGAISGSVLGMGGDDHILISGGSIGGNVNAERIDLFGGSILGNIIADAGGSININPASIGGLTLGGNMFVSGAGSRLTVNGAAELAGTLDARDAIIDMQDGAADDTLTLGGLTMRNSTIAVDVDQSAATSDRISAVNSDVSGPNFLNVSLLNTPNFTEETAIPIVVGGSLNAADFTVTGLPDDPASMFGFRLDQGADGGLVLYARPTNTTPATATQAAIDSRPIVTATDALSDVTKEAADNGLGLGGGSQAQIAPSFGVFSTGQFGRTEHDGFKVYNPNFVGAGPSFTADDFSAAISLDFNAGEHFGLGENVGLNLGLFGGYATSDVALDAYQQFSSSVGEATNESVLIGGYGLFRQGYNYALVSGTAFIGQTDVTNYAVGSTASYDTIGYAVTASAGRIFMLNDRVKFDLRGGILGATFEGESYTDSKGVKFGKSKVSFGAVKFEPGIYADYQWENGMIFTPYARLDLQQRFGYENSANLGGQDFDFEDDDFSAAISSGFNVRMSQHATLSAEVRGKLSGDSSTVAGKLGLKIGF